MSKSKGIDNTKGDKLGLRERVANGLEAAGTWQENRAPMQEYIPADAPAQYQFAQMPIMAAEGRAIGAIPRRQVRDKVPALLTEGEYVVPADVVSAVGIEKLDKLVAKYHRPGA